MGTQDDSVNKEEHKLERRLSRRVRFFAVIYRIVLVAGLLVLIAAVVLLIATNLFTVWILLLPAALITLGILLARVEYRLDLRLYALNNQVPEQPEE